MPSADLTGVLQCAGAPFTGVGALQARDGRASAEQTSHSETPDASETPLSAEFPKQTSSSERSDTFLDATTSSTASDDPHTSHSPAAAPRPTPRAEWIGTTHARCLLGVGSANTIKAWVGYGYLRGRRLPNGRTQVLLQDVLALRSSSLLAPSPPR